MHWVDVKELLQPLTVVNMESYNRETGECVVGFIEPFNRYFIKGKLQFIGQEVKIAIEDHMELYKVPLNFGLDRINKILEVQESKFRVVCKGEGVCSMCVLDLDIIQNKEAKQKFAKVLKNI